MKLRLPTLLILTILLLPACGNPQGKEVNEASEGINLELQQIQANLTQQLRQIQNENKGDHFEQAIESLKKQNEPITEEELERGWYYASEGFKKYATPNSWVYQSGTGDQSGRWIHPDLINAEVVNDEEILCRMTSGTYVKSCTILETASECEYLPQSTCRCPEKSQWDAKEGCLKLNEQGALVAISKKELEQGYYPGLSYEKKKGTPQAWVWNAQHTLWHSPYLLDFSNLSK